MFYVSIYREIIFYALSTSSYFFCTKLKTQTSKPKQISSTENKVVPPETVILFFRSLKAVLEKFTG